MYIRDLKEIQKVLNEESELQEDINEYNDNEGLGVQATIRRQLGIAKIPQVIEYAQNLLQTQEKIVIFAYHRDVINELRRRLAGYGVRAILGGMTAKGKQMEVDLFIRDKNSRIFIGQFTAAGFGVDGLQKAASDIVFAEIDWVPGNMDQARDRVRRIGQINPVVAHYLVVPETLEDEMLQTVIRKGKVITRILSNTSKEKEKKTMTIENSLERIANALEGIQDTLKNAIGTAEDVQEARKKKSSKKKAEPTEPAPIEPVEPVAVAEVVEDTTPVPVADNSVDDLLGVDTPAETKVELTLDDVRTAFTAFIKAAPDQATGVQQAKAVLTKYGYTLVPEVKPEHYAAVINDLKVA